MAFETHVIYMHLFRSSFMNKMSEENKVILNALCRQRAAIEQVEQEAIQDEAVVTEPKPQEQPLAHPSRIKEACGPLEHVVQLDRGNDIEGLSPRGTPGKGTTLQCPP